MPQSPERFIPVFDHSHRPNAGRMPEWIRLNLDADPRYADTARAVHEQGLNTVCEEARCPNRGECWARGTATFMLLGETCTRACGFCSVQTGRPDWFDNDEPRRVAEAATAMGLDYIVLTSVNRDDMADGGARIFAETLREVRRRDARMGVEFLTPDFQQDMDGAVDGIAAAAAEFPLAESEPADLVWGHNVETVPSLYREVRKGSRYERSLELLERAAALPRVEAKSALMLGMGETADEVAGVLRDLRACGVERIALGQYLRPTRYHLPVKEYVSPEQFDEYAAIARELGFGWVKAGPLVRSSYHAEERQDHAIEGASA
ncbi:MAG: lipoyl synthase [Thiohalospira sp.]